MAPKKKKAPGKKKIPEKGKILDIDQSIVEAEIGKAARTAIAASRADMMQVVKSVRKVEPTVKPKSKKGKVRHSTRSRLRL